MKTSIQLFCFLFLISLSVIAQQYEIKEINNISYYEKGSELDTEKTQLNLVIPEGVENAPVFIWIGQGAWAYVDRHKEMGFCRSLAKRGVIVVSVGHRLSPALLWEPKVEEGIKHPEHVKDIAQSIKWLVDNSEEYGFKTEKLFVGGFSSGAHLSALIASDGSYLENLGLSKDIIKGIVPVGGGFDIPHYKEDLIKEDPAYEFNHINVVFGETHEEHLNASPTEFIDNLKASVLLISEKDTYKYNKIFEDLLVKRQYEDFQAINVHNMTHGGLWMDFIRNEKSIYTDFIADFLVKKIKRIKTLTFEILNNSRH
jgi:Esterase/lipase